MLLEEHKTDISESLKEIQGNMYKLETWLIETQKSLKEIQENKAQEIEANKKETHTHTHTHTPVYYKHLTLQTILRV